MSPKNRCIPFKASIEHLSLPARLDFPYDYTPHPLAVLAAEELQDYIEEQSEWVHNFGWEGGKDEKAHGKMFGVLVVETKAQELFYLAAFSGKLARANDHDKFVPPVFDTLKKDGFLNKGMLRLDEMNTEVRDLLAQENPDLSAKIEALKKQRKQFSNDLQNQIFDHYHFSNSAGEMKSLREIFAFSPKNPPSGAGECAAPKLLQYAFQNELKPIALAEFWWGSPKSDNWLHGEYYPVCTEKCQPILEHMLVGLEVAPK